MEEFVDLSNSDIVFLFISQNVRFGKIKYLNHWKLLWLHPSHHKV